MSRIESPFSQLRVLLVDDSPVSRDLLLQFLDQLSCKVTVAINGDEAVCRFAEQAFDLVLMDVQMPVMDGLMATRMIRGEELEEGTRAVIIGVTASMDRETCLAAGMDDHFEKPVSAASLREILEQWFPSRKLTPEKNPS